MTQVYAIASQKGGTGKTSTAVSISAGLARKGRRVLLVDIDSQANASKVLMPEYQKEVNKNRDATIYRTIIERKPLPVTMTGVPNLSLVPSHILLSDTDVVLTTAIDHRESRLKTFLDPIKDQYEFVFVDCPPALSWLTLNAFTASDLILVVISPGYFELESTRQICRTIREVQENFNPHLKLRGFLFTMSDPTVNSKVSLKILRQTYPELVLNTIIPRNVDLKDASMKKTDIFAYRPKAAAAEAYQRLIQEVFL